MTLIRTIYRKKIPVLYGVLLAVLLLFHRRNIMMYSGFPWFARHTDFSFYIYLAGIWRYRVLVEELCIHLIIKNRAFNRWYLRGMRWCWDQLHNLCLTASFSCYLLQKRRPRFLQYGMGGQTVGRPWHSSGTGLVCPTKPAHLIPSSPKWKPSTTAASDV